MKIELYAKIDKIVRNLNLAILTIFLIIVNLNMEGTPFVHIPLDTFNCT